MSVRANAFAIASIMSDPEAAAESAALLHAYGYSTGHLTAAASLGGVSAGLGYGRLGTGPADCRYQMDWAAGQHSGDSNGYSRGAASGIKAMEGRSSGCFLLITTIFF